jgi:hypothetical protein
VRKDRLRPRANKRATFNWEDRMREKQAARDKDDDDLRSGKVTPEQLQQRNSMFAGLDLSKATVVRRRK